MFRGPMNSRIRVAGPMGDAARREIRFVEAPEVARVWPKYVRLAVAMALAFALGWAVL